MPRTPSDVFGSELWGARGGINFELEETQTVDTIGTIKTLEAEITTNTKGSHNCQGSLGNF